MPHANRPPCNGHTHAHIKLEIRALLASSPASPAHGSRSRSLSLAHPFRLAGGGSGVSAFKHLSHEFLVVAGPPDNFHYGGTAEYIVDPRFREQFDIPQVSVALSSPCCSTC